MTGSFDYILEGKSKNSKVKTLNQILKMKLLSINLITAKQ